MFGMILRTQWNWTRGAVLGFAALAFLAPAMAWRLASGGMDAVASVPIIDGFSMLGPILGFLSLVGAFVLAAMPWTIDAESRHVYALSLPVRWSRFVAMRFGAGALTLLVPALGLYLGALATVAMIELPPLLRAYPGALAARFLLASLVAYAFTFALQYLAGRKATLVALTAALVLGAIGFTLWTLGLGHLSNSVGRFVFEWPGPLAVFVDSWTLIDV